MRRMLRRTLSFTACLAVLLVVLWTIWNFLATRKLAGEVRLLAAAGLPASLSELRPAEIPAPENAAPYYRAAFALLETAPRDEVLDLVYEAAKRPRCDFGLRYEDGMDAVLDHIPPLRKLGPMLAERALERAEAEEIDKAFEDLRVLFRMSRSVEAEACLVSQLCRFQISSAGLGALEKLLPLSESPVERVTDIDPDAGRGGVERGLRGEAAMVLGILGSGVIDRELGLPAWLGERGLLKPYLKGEVARSVKFVRLTIGALSRPYPQAREEIVTIARETVERGGRWLRILIPPISKVLDKEAELASRAAMARLAARVLEHRRATGEFPAGLEPFRDTGLVDDPRTGKPYRLVQVEGRRYLESEGDLALRWSLEPEDRAPGGSEGDG